VVDKIKAMLSDKKITGVFDERGKFIYISESDQDKIAELIRRRGRISIEELAMECNRMIKLEKETKPAEPTEEVTDK